MLVNIDEKGFVATNLPKIRILQKLIFKFLGIKKQRVKAPTLAQLVNELADQPGVARFDLQDEAICCSHDLIHVTGKAAMLIIQTEDLDELS